MPTASFDSTSGAAAALVSRLSALGLRRPALLSVSRPTGLGPLRALAALGFLGTTTALGSPTPLALPGEPATQGGAPSEQEEPPDEEAAVVEDDVGGGEGWAAGRGDPVGEGEPVGRGGTRPEEAVAAAERGGEAVEREGRAADAVVFLSTGERLRGRLRLGGAGTLRVYDLGTRRTHRLALEAIDSIRCFVEEERVEEAWAFEEGGSRKKVRLGWTYPYRAYRHEFQLRSGHVIEGHSQAAVLYLDDGSADRKIVLPRYEKGGRGESLESLVYPASIQLGAERPGTAVAGKGPAPLAELSGEVEGLTAVALVERSSGRSYGGSVAPGGSFRVAGLLPGEYAAFLLRGAEVVHGLGPAEDLADLEGIRAKIAGLAEFFPSRKIAAASGPADSPRILVELERAGGTTLAGEGGASFRVRRWELWTLRKIGSEWAIASRAFLFRAAVPPGATFPPASYRAEPRCAKVILGAGKNALEGAGRERERR